MSHRARHIGTRILVVTLIILALFAIGFVLLGQGQINSERCAALIEQSRNPNLTQTQSLLIAEEFDERGCSNLNIREPE